MLKKVFITLLASVGLIAGAGVPAYATGPYFFYAGARQVVTDTMVAANFSVHTPTKAAADFHTLAEMTAETGSGSTYQAVEFGWTVDPTLNGGSSTPHLFVYWRKNGVGQCYNTTCAGYTPYAGTSPYTAGGSLAGVTSMKLIILHSGSAWWFWAGNVTGSVGDWIGYIPDSKWTTPWTSYTFTQLFGEVAAATTSPTTQMGDGNCATSTAGASISSVGLFSGPANLTAFQLTPTQYTVSMLSARTFRYGGDGSCP